MKKLLLALLVLCTTIPGLMAQDLDNQFEEIIQETYRPEEPGAVFLVARHGKPIYQKAIGKANLEHDIDLHMGQIFELGSISKQFTAVAILMLLEDGRLSLEDPINKFIPDYPNHGKNISIHQLLNHTSGIKNYTAMGDLRSFALEDRSPKELIDYFKNEELEFEPGSQFSYSNSGYILLGHIIEQISQRSYEDFIENEIFKPLGMTKSQYGSKKEIISNRASGYQVSEQGYANADYMSMSIPYAAGALMSTLDDMLKWQNALRAHRLISEESMNKAIYGSKLNDGTEIPYGYGLVAKNLKGSKGYAHSGGIFGFSTNGLYLEEEEVYVIGLSNCNCKDVIGVSRKLAAAAIGKAFPNLKDSISLPLESMKKWVGAYAFENDVIRHIFMKEGQLYSMKESHSNSEYRIFPLSEDRYMFEDGTEYRFSSRKDGKNQVIMSSDMVHTGIAVEKERPKDKEAISLPIELMKRYVGEYKLGPNFSITIRIEEGRIFAQATGQNQFEIYAESETNFFVKVVPATIRFNEDSKGQITSLTLFQGGQEMLAEKIL